jgi:ankyrin repeat protein
MKRHFEEESNLPDKFSRTNNFIDGNNSYINPKTGDTFLHEILRNREFDKATEFIKLFGNELINKRNNDNQTPLSIAIEKGGADMVEFLINSGADIFNRDADGSSAIHIAAIRGNTQIIDTLVEHGALVNELDDMNTTPLNYACNYGNIEATQALINHGAETEGYREVNPLTMAAFQGCTDNVRLLLKQGANPNGSVIAIGNVNDDENNDGDTMEDISDDDFNNIYRSSPLHHAVFDNNLGIIMLLIADGANILIVNKDGETPLSIANEPGDLINESIRSYLNLINEIDTIILSPNINKVSINYLFQNLLFLGNILEEQKIENISIQDLRDAIQKRVINNLHKENFNSSVEKFQEAIINVSNNLKLLAANGILLEQVEDYLTLNRGNSSEDNLFSLYKISLSQFSLAELEKKLIFNDSLKDTLINDWHQLPYTLQCSGEGIISNDTIEAEV